MTEFRNAFTSKVTKKIDNIKISTTDPAEFHTDRSAFERMTVEKPVLAHNKGRPCLWMRHGRQ